MMKTVQEYSVLAGLNLDVRYGAKGELETFNDDSFANVNVLN
ncbi:hypothetical protein [Metabacillus sediminilitoris]|nr:hypothetical protein [Metabacillus sediminilitoris]